MFTEPINRRKVGKKSMAVRRCGLVFLGRQKGDDRSREIGERLG